MPQNSTFCAHSASPRPQSALGPQSRPEAVVSEWEASLPAAFSGPVSGPPKAPGETKGTQAVGLRTVSDYLVEQLILRGIEVVSGIPGGAILPLYDAIAQSSLRHVLARNEQGAGFIAQGMARVSGRAAVCLATSGPGATNLITALADAYADSVPLLAITAQVPRALIGSDAFQEVPTCKLVRDVTKACFDVQSPAQLPALLQRAFELAEKGRKGPVLLDIPKDVLNAPWDADEPQAQGAPWQSCSPVVRQASKAGPSRSPVLSAANEATWQQLARRLADSARPLLYVGGGVRWAGAEAALAALCERARVPVVSSLHGLGSLPATHPLHWGMLGMHGEPRANHATERADFVLAVGARFDDRATGDVARFCPRAEIAHIDIDPRELGKNKPIQWGVACDARYALTQLLRWVEPAGLRLWSTETQPGSEQAMLPEPGPAAGVLGRLDRALPRDAIVTTDVGQHQMWVAQRIGFSPERTLLTSGGLGTMGFGLPAAIGAALQQPERKVVCVSGDGSLLMNLSELATLSELRLNVLIVLLNNAQLGMVRQQQEMFYHQRLSASRFECRPDFVQLAQGFGVEAVACEPEQATVEWLGKRCEAGRPQLVEVQLAEDEPVLPIVPAGCANGEMRMR